MIYMELTAKNKHTPWAKIGGTALALLSVVTCQPAVAQQSWQLFESLPKSPQVLRIFQNRPSVLFMASGGDLFSCDAKAHGCDRIFRIRGEAAKINDLKILPAAPNRVFALTTEGLFESKYPPKDWSQIYSGLSKRQNVLSLAQNPIEKDLFYLGTEKGVLISKDGGKTWSPTFAELANLQIFDIETDFENFEIYFSTNKGIYRYHISNDSLKHVFHESFFDSNELAEDKSKAEEPETKNGIDSYADVIVTNHPDFPLAAIMKTGIFISGDEGETWQSLPNSGLGRIAVRDLLYVKEIKTFFAATEKGVFRFIEKQKIWEKLFEGLPDEQVFSLALSPEKPEKLLAAAKKGIFAYDIHPPQYEPEIQLTAQSIDLRYATQLFSLEPSVRELHNQAIRYADVGNGKIKRWHTLSRLRALVPDLSFSKGLDIGNDVHVDTGSTTTPDIFVQGPDDRDKSTDINLSWDLGDLLFNTSQTSIDSREKLMVELRDEILAEVTRL